MKKGFLIIFSQEGALDLPLFEFLLLTPPPSSTFELPRAPLSRLRLHINAFHVNVTDRDGEPTETRSGRPGGGLAWKVAPGLLCITFCTSR